MHAKLKKLSLHACKIKKVKFACMQNSSKYQTIIYFGSLHIIDSNFADTQN